MLFNSHHVSGSRFDCSWLKWTHFGKCEMIIGTGARHQTILGVDVPQGTIEEPWNASEQQCQNPAKSLAYLSSTTYTLGLQAVCIWLCTLQLLGPAIMGRWQITIHILLGLIDIGPRVIGPWLYIYICDTFSLLSIFFFYFFFFIILYIYLCYFFCYTCYIFVETHSHIVMVINSKLVCSLCKHMKVFKIKHNFYHKNINN